jgi:outer membrane protein assembly factor BamB
MNVMRLPAVGRLVLPAIVCLCATSAALAQRPGTTKGGGMPPAWTQRLPGVVMWQRAVPGGGLLVATNKALYGIDTASGRIAWERPAKRPVTQEQCLRIGETPYHVVPSGGRDNRDLILDVRSGRVLHDSSSAGLERILDAFVLPRHGGLTVIGERSRGSATAMSLIEPSSGKVLWNVDGPPAKGARPAARPAAMQGQAPPADGFVSEALELEDGVLLASTEGVYRVDRRNGKILWRAPHVERPALVRFFVAPGQPDLVVVTTEVWKGNNGAFTRFSAHRLADGAAVWKEPLKLRGNSGPPIPFAKGILLSAHLQDQGRLEYVDLASGLSLWGTKGKGMEIPGGIMDHQTVGDGLVLVMGVDSVWTKKGMVYFLNLLDPKTVAFRFKKGHKVEGRLVATEVVARGLLYLTTKELNILDPQTGQPLLEESVVSDGNLVAAARDHLLYAFSDDEGALYVVDTRAGTLRRLSTERVKLADGDVPVSLEAGADRITLIGGQTVVAFGHDGAVQFHAHHPAPKYGGFIRTLLTVNAVAAGASSTMAAGRGLSYAGTAGSMPAGSFGRMIFATAALDQAGTAAGQAAVASGSLRALQTRFKATSEGEDVVFMMVRLSSGDVGLARVSKATGQILSHIDLGGDRNPDYQLDPPAGRLFYKIGNNEILGYSFPPAP